MKPADITVTVRNESTVRNEPTDSRYESRVVPISFEIEQRGEGEDEKSRIVGHAAVFNRWSEDLGGFREKIRPGAFAAALEKAPDVRALFNHRSDFVLGRTKSGTLSLSEDKVGLLAEIDPPDTSFARDLMISIERGDIDQMSFGFRTIVDEWTQPKGSKTLAERELVEVELIDVSPVTFPAYQQTKVAVRALEARAKLVNADVARRYEYQRRRLELAEAEGDW